MWETIKEVLISDNSLIILIFLLIVIILIVVLIKHGYISITTKAVRLGDTSERERIIIRHQTEYAHAFCTGICGKLLLFPNDVSQTGGYHTKYIFERVYDTLVDWIVLNHIRVDKDYINYKQRYMWNMLHTFSLPEEYKTKEFHDRVDSWVEEVIVELHKIRLLYSKQLRSRYE